MNTLLYLVTGRQVGRVPRLKLGANFPWGRE